MDKILQTIIILVILEYISARDIGNFVYCGLDFRGAGTKSVFLYYEHDVICIRLRKFSLTSMTPVATIISRVEKTCGFL